MKKKVTSFYDQMGVARDVAPDVLRLAYRRLAQKYHPDKAHGHTHSAALMAQINKAYEVLSDPAQRAAYDQSLDAAAPPSATSSRFVPLAIGGWPWYLLCATLSAILLTLGFVAARTLAPQRVVPVTPVGTLKVSMPADTLANVTPAQPWAPPAQQAAPLANDPVSRLVRDGVLPTPAATSPAQTQAPGR